MSGATGRDSQVGFGEEVTWGTAVTPTRFIEHVSEGVSYDRERIESQGIMAGAKRQRRWTKGREGGTGPLQFEVMPNGAALLFKHCLGAVATTTPSGATNARLHTCTEGNLDALSLTVQVGRPNINNTVDPYTYAGCKVGSWELSMEENGLLMCTVNFDAKSETTATALATADYPDENYLLGWADPNIAITVNGETYPIRQITIGDDNGLKTDRYGLGSSQKLKQVEGTQNRAGTGTIDLVDYQGLTPYNLFVNGTEFEVSATFTGVSIESGFLNQVEVTLPRCRADGTTTNVEGPDTLAQQLPFVALEPEDGSSGISIAVTNTDVAA